MEPQRQAWKFASMGLHAGLRGDGAEIGFFIILHLHVVMPLVCLKLVILRSRKSKTCVRTF